MGDWSTTQLYEIVNDPGETTGRRRRHPHVAAELLSAFDRPLVGRGSDPMMVQRRRASHRTTSQAAFAGEALTKKTKGASGNFLPGTGSVIFEKVVLPFCCRACLETRSSVFGDAWNLRSLHERLAYPVHIAKFAESQERLATGAIQNLRVSKETRLRALQNLRGSEGTRLPCNSQNLRVLRATRPLRAISRICESRETRLTRRGNFNFLRVPQRDSPTLAI